MAYQVQEIYCKYIMLDEFAEQEFLFNGKYAACSFGNVSSIVATFVTEHGVRFYSKWRRQLLYQLVTAVRCFCCSLQRSLDKYKEFIAFLATVTYAFAVVVVYKVKNNVLEYGCYVVLAHSLKVGQGQKVVVHNP